MDECTHGHEMTAANTYWRRDGRGRQCRSCKNQRQQAKYRRDLESGRVPHQQTPEGKQKRLVYLANRWRTDTAYRERELAKNKQRYWPRAYGVDLEVLGNRCEWTCYLCGDALTSHDVLEIDHVVPIAAGGTGHPRNLALTHQHCNRRKSNTRVSLLRWAHPMAEDRTKEFDGA